ncbi:hypothetical protein [Sedimenticola selenatireducens]|uniref:Replication protein n=1 Tax=Sedimenticola selenatireducens TaxID=191960 RepID=A0A557SLZ9_9GAMM|nr:hypothetical protein [Sedimenticola selenatireducens]TVO78451.1 hypothetical protein FHP88_01945 [Sedimenticola selenatireducens]TVT62690.1 MAG: hypothetical protein FHK78_13510 [Sedimenticola selenatireducens]
MAKPKPYKREGGYVKKWEVILASSAYRDLKPVARCLLEEFQRIYRPARNGTLSISLKRAQTLINAGETAVMEAFKQLVANGFIVLTHGELWQQRKAREWRLTFEPYANGREPSDEWKYWTPKLKPDPENRADLPGYQGSESNKDNNTDKHDYLRL